MCPNSSIWRMVYAANFSFASIEEVISGSATYESQLLQLKSIYTFYLIEIESIFVPTQFAYFCSQRLNFEELRKYMLGSYQSSF